jgi:hypothetical protein
VDKQQGSRQVLERGWRQDQLTKAVRLSVYWEVVEGIGGEQIVMVSEAGVGGEKQKGERWWGEIEAEHRWPECRRLCHSVAGVEADVQMVSGPIRPWSVSSPQASSEACRG